MSRSERCDDFNLRVHDFLRDTREWPSTAVGVYVRLLLNGWRDLDRPGWYSSNPDALQRLAAVPDAEWSAAWPWIQTAMKERAGHLYQHGQAKEYDRQTRSYKRSQEASKRANRIRWHGNEMSPVRTPNRIPDGLRIGLPQSSLPLTLGVGSSENDSNVGGVGGPGGEGTAPATPARRRGHPDRLIPDGYPAQLAARFGLPLETVNGLAEKILVEFDARGLKSAKGALLRWTERQALRTASEATNGATPTRTPNPEPKCPACGMVLAEYANEPRCIACGKELPR